MYKSKVCSKEVHTHTHMDDATLTNEYTSNNIMVTQLGCHILKQIQTFTLKTEHLNLNTIYLS